METTPQPSERRAFPNASPWKRLVAVIIDAVILLIVSAIVRYVIGELLGSLAGLIIGIVYYVYFWSSQGATPGKSALKLKVVDANGNIPDGGKAFIRYIGYWISLPVFALGYIWILIDASNQGWHDKIAGTYVVDESVGNKW